MICSARPTTPQEKKEDCMKRLSYLVLTAVLMVVLSLSALSQPQKPADHCAEFKIAPKGESAADKKKRQANLKACTDKQKADAKAPRPQAPNKAEKEISKLPGRA
jgi:hypothetical protein